MLTNGVGGVRRIAKRPPKGTSSTTSYDLSRGQLGLFGKPSCSEDREAVCTWLRLTARLVDLPGHGIARNHRSRGDHAILADLHVVAATAIDAEKTALADFAV